MLASRLTYGCWWANVTEDINVLILWDVYAGAYAPAFLLLSNGGGFY